MRGWQISLAVLLLVGVLSLAYFTSDKPMTVGEFSNDDVEALARMLASEDPTQPDNVQQALAWTAVNMANRKGKTVYELLAPDGKYGPQSGRYASTANSATDRFRNVARSVLDGSVTDPTPGAIQFDHPATQDWLYEHGKASLDAAGVAASRAADGRTAFFLPGVSPTHLRFWV